MPRLVKGGKYVFGWSVIGEDGGVVIPGEAVLEYGFEPDEKVILMPGSRTSGGFSVAKKSKIEESVFSEMLGKNPELAEFRIGEGRTVNFGGRALCWLGIREDGSLMLTHSALEAYSVRPGDRLLAVRGSSTGVGMIARGPIIAEALRHPDIEVFTAVI